MKAAALRRPLAWAALSGAALLLASSLPHEAPGWLFWGALGVSCIGAAAWSLTAPEADERTEG